MSSQQVGLIGYGRMGKVLAQLLLNTPISSQEIEIFVYDVTPGQSQPHLHFSDLATVLKQKTIFIAVPIREFAAVIETAAPLISVDATVIDVCSVKKFPVEIMEKYLPKHNSM